MNWIKKTLQFGEKIKRILKKDLQKKILKILTGLIVVKDQY